jgi:hypothetical protein
LPALKLARKRADKSRWHTTAGTQKAPGYTAAVVYGPTGKSAPFCKPLWVDAFGVIEGTSIASLKEGRTAED